MPQPSVAGPRAAAARTREAEVEVRQHAVVALLVEAIGGDDGAAGHVVQVACGAGGRGGRVGCRRGREGCAGKGSMQRVAATRHKGQVWCCHSLGLRTNPTGVLPKSYQLILC